MNTLLFADDHLILGISGDNLKIGIHSLKIAEKTIALKS